MKLRNRLFRILICACLLFLSASCEPRQFAPPPSPPAPADVLEPRSQQLNARVYIDASASMVGFVVPGSTTNYVKTLQPLETAVIGGWPSGDVKFYRFGAQVQLLPDRTYLQAAQSNFYLDDKVSQATLIQTAIDHADASGLTVIVTDLFQRDGDVPILMKKLKEKYLQNNLVVGVLGLKSQFDGIVTDVGIGIEPFRYRNTENLESYRPFYVLMLGKHADVAHYFEQLKNKLSFVSATNFIIFSHHLVNPLASFANATIDKIDRLVAVGTLVVPDVIDKRLEQFRMRGNTKNAEFFATFRYTLLPYTMSFNPAELEFEVVAKQCQPNPSAESREAKRIFALVASEEARQSFIIEHITPSNAGVQIEIEITPETLPGKGIYQYEVILRPQESAYQMPVWFSRWDMGNTREGSKTLNLNRFLSDLWQATFQIHRPKVAQFYCYIQKK